MAAAAGRMRGPGIPRPRGRVQTVSPPRGGPAGAAQCFRGGFPRCGQAGVGQLGEVNHHRLAGLEDHALRLLQLLPADDALGAEGVGIFRALHQRGGPELGRAGCQLPRQVIDVKLRAGRQHDLDRAGDGRGGVGELGHGRVAGADADHLAVGDRPAVADVLDLHRILEVAPLLERRGDEGALRGGQGGRDVVGIEGRVGREADNNPGLVGRDGSLLRLDGRRRVRGDARARDDRSRDGVAVAIAAAAAAVAAVVSRPGVAGAAVDAVADTAGVGGVAAPAAAAGVGIASTEAAGGIVPAVAPAVAAAAAIARAVRLAAPVHPPTVGGFGRGRHRHHHDHAVHRVAPPLGP
jgi:hypothetical protein